MLRSLIESMIAYARTTRGWSQAEFAAHAGLTAEGLSRAKNGCSGRTLEKLAEAAGMAIIAVPDDAYLRKVASGTLLGEIK